MPGMFRKAVLTGALLALAVPLAARTPPVADATDVAPFPTESYGEWIVEKIDGEYVAATKNPLESIFGMVCFETCQILFIPRLKCDHGTTTPAILNTPAGALSINLRCMKLKKENSYVLEAPLQKDLLDAMEIGGEMGIAFPLENGKFQVSRFSLTGALKAAKRAYELTYPNGKPDAGQGLRDQTL